MPASTSPSEPKAIAQFGEDLRGAMDTLIEAIPGVERRPSSLARSLGVNRVILSKLLNALKRPDPLEVLQQVPGPDSLRSIVEAAGLVYDVPPTAIDGAHTSIESFASLIRDHFGTRGALDAAISDENEALRKRYEESARYEVYNGMRHVLGVEGETWLTSMIFTPNPEDDDFLTVTAVHGVLGMRCLRPDTPVRFTFGPPYKAPGEERNPLASRIALREYYANEPAPLVTELHNGQLVHRLAPGDIGKDAVADMIAVSHDPRGSRRYAAPDRALGGVALFLDVPVKTLHCDALVHESAFPGATPRLIVYNPGARGPANPNDPSRDLDRIDAREPVEALAYDPERLEAPGAPNYAPMLRRVFAEIGEDPEAYRVFRVRVAYPVQSFQYVLAFDAPQRA